MKQRNNNERGKNTSNKKYSNNNKSKNNFRKRKNSFFNNKRRKRNNSKVKIDYNKYSYTPKEQTKEEAYVPPFEYHEIQGLNNKLKKNILKKGYKTPTEIQARSIPVLLKSKDVLGLANTGTGKTAAFLIPLINKVANDPSQKVLIIVPTRELAAQIEKEFLSLKYGLDIRSVLCVGGQNIRKQIKGLRSNFNFLIGTPGRIIDLEQREEIDLSIFNNIVLDEVDRMLDMGFVDEIKGIIENLPSDKHSMFYSATIDKRTEKIIENLLKDYIEIKVESISPLELVDQDYKIVKSEEEKFDLLTDMVESNNEPKMLVFTETKRKADKLAKRLHSEGIKVDSIHGDKSQYVRNKVLKKFKEDKINTLVATDVAARGIDVKDINYVINYDEPNNYEDYTHRVGRTGRAGKKGNSMTFVLPNKAKKTRSFRRRK